MVCNTETKQFSESPEIQKVVLPVPLFRYILDAYSPQRTKFTHPAKLPSTLHHLMLQSILLTSVSIKYSRKIVHKIESEQATKLLQVNLSTRGRPVLFPQLYL